MNVPAGEMLPTFLRPILSVKIVSITVSPTAVMCPLILLHALATIQNPYLSNTCCLSSLTCPQNKSLCFTYVCPSI